MSFYADLHIHSKYSRATSSDCNLVELAYWARKKGLAVLGTGDFTHPAWLQEIRDTLVPAEPGLFRLQDGLDREVQKRLPVACQGPVRFLLSVEISTIYKKGDRTRKVHHVILVPDLAAADRLVETLSRIGNLKSDGRPILGLDSRNLLEIALGSGDGAFLIPAHIWTPWFSALGSKSGFDSIAECYADLAPHIFAVETGLSSDPLMNWRVANLDRYRLVSNSDCHSPAKLGREACVFDTNPDYFAMRDALRTGAGYGGTVEFFPEEGKYHLDGHRKCEVCWEPGETRRHKGLCPVCGKPVTVGVMSRVEELADRPEGFRPEGAAGYRHFIPLAEVLGEIFGTGAAGKKVAAAYETLLARFGGELQILEHVPLDEIRRCCSPLFAEAIARMRQGRVIREAGYDGEYGAIRVFRPEELQGEGREGRLFEEEGVGVPSFAAAATKDKQGAEFRKKKSAIRVEKREIGEGDTAESAARAGKVREPGEPYDAPSPSTGILAGLDPEQRAAAETAEGPLAILAGPGTGKTRVLTHRIARLVADRGVPPEQCLAIAFTRRAAGQMKERLGRLLPTVADRIPVMTFHGLGYSIVREHGVRFGLGEAVRVAGDAEQVALAAKALGTTESKARRLLAVLAGVKPPGALTEDDVRAARAGYERAKREAGCVDFDDLIRLPLEWLSADQALRDEYRRRYPWVSVDEFQDIDSRQYGLLRQLVPPDGNLCAIGDPDQSIYGFRGSDPGFFQRLAADFPNVRSVSLTHNYRSGKRIIAASVQVMAPSTLVQGRTLEAQTEDETRLTIHEAATDKAEAEFVVHTVERLIGGSTFFSLDSGRVGAGEGESLSFSDFAVLYRTDTQASVLVEAFVRSGMPFQKRSHAGLVDLPLVQELIEALRAQPKSSAPAERLDGALASLDEARQREALPVALALRPVAERHGTLDGFLSELALGVDADLWDPRADAVSLLTLHAAKGLEFPVVFVVGCEDGVLPLYWGSGEDCDRAEERRLFFVGMTRARRRLFLCHARARRWQGAVREMRPSPFLADIREDLLDRSRAEAAKKKRRPTGEQLSLF